MQSSDGVGLGTFPFSKVFRIIDETDAREVVYAFLDLGGRYIQTAPYYEGVDPLMGRILRDVPRDRYYLSTLCAKNRQGVRTGTYEAIMEQCDDSLGQLGLDHLDLYMTSTTKVTDASFGETIGAMQDLQKQGKIRDIGVANVTLEQLREYNSTGIVQFVQNRFSLINPSIGDEFNRYCSEHGIGLIPYNTIEHGLLTKRILGEFELREDDLRHILPEFRDEAVDVIRRWAIAHLKPIADSADTSIEALAIWWALKQPNAVICVVGATTVEQITSSFGALEIPDEPRILNRLDEAYAALENDIRERYSQGVQEFLGNFYG